MSSELIEDTHLLPKDVEEVFRRVQDSAHYMPNYQMEVSCNSCIYLCPADDWPESDGRVTW